MTAYSNWKYDNPVRIAFGPGALLELPSHIGSARALLVIGSFASRTELKDKLTKLLDNRLDRILDHVQPNPTLDQLEASAQATSAQLPEILVAVGGGSVLDTAKVLSLLLPAIRCGFSLRQHFEQKLALPDIAPLPVIAVPTTAGTGSEVTPFATVWDPPCGKKYSLLSPRLFPRAALLDPTLTVGLPTEPTVSTGLDALSHGLESIWNRNASPVTMLQGTRAVSLVLQTLPRLLDAPDDLSLRALMLEAGLFGGLAISNSKTALAHSISYPITARLGLPHGLACSFTLPAVLDFNAAEDDGRLRTLAASLGLESVVALQSRLVAFLTRIGIAQHLQAHRICGEKLRALVPEMVTPERSNNNLRRATPDDIAGIIAETERMFLQLQENMGAVSRPSDTRAIRQAA